MSEPLNFRPKVAGNPDPGPIANAEAHLDSILRGMAGIAAHAAVARLIEYTRLLEHARTPEPPSMKAWEYVYTMKGPK